MAITSSYFKRILKFSAEKLNLNKAIEYFQFAFEKRILGKILDTIRQKDLISVKFDF